MLSPRFVVKPLSYNRYKGLLTAILAGFTLAFSVMWLVSVPGSRAASDPVVTSVSAPPAALPALNVSRQITTTPLDIVVAFDISGSMEDQTTCHDCWVRNSYNPNWPGGAG